MKRFLFLLGVSLFFSFTAFSQEAVYQLSSHILDINIGKPAPDVVISLSKKVGDDWKVIDEKRTDKDGRVKEFLDKSKGSNEGIYKLTYHVAPYFEKQQQDTFYPFIEVVFEIKDDKHYHVPITLSPFGYSTYRGS